MFSEIDEKYFCDEELGAVYSKESTTFRVWSPIAQSCTLKLYNVSGVVEKLVDERTMQKSEKGVWEVKVQGDLNGTYYTYALTINGICRETIDIYAKAGGVNGRLGEVLDFSQTNPDGWTTQRKITLGSPCDAVIYELHVRDFSADKNATFKHRGKFLAFTEKGVTNSFGDKVGIEHIKELGVTHVHILPMFDFATIDEACDAPEFNWGYDPLNFNFPEGSYSTNAFDGAVRVCELKQMIMALHNEGIGVVMDVVYNHTYNAERSPFDASFPKYYYRSCNGKYSNGSGCGNEFATERKMAGKFIADSLVFWANEYKLDGFRFDLMGLLDINLINKISHKLKAINPNILLYGEGWTGGKSPLEESERAVKANAKKVPLTAMFSDDFRDIVKGSVFVHKGKGFVNGGSPDVENVKVAMIGGVYHPQLAPEKALWATNPTQTVNYVEAHDNLTLWDKLTITIPRNTAMRVRADKLATAMVFFAMGVPFIQAGQEFLRSKPLGNRKFDDNSYKSPDSVNAIRWSLKTTNAEVFEYYKGLIAIRKAYPELRMASGEEIAERVRFLEGMESGVIGIEIGDRLTLFLNSNQASVQLALDGEYNVLCNHKKASAEPFMKLSGKADVEEVSALLLLRA